MCYWGAGRLAGHVDRSLLRQLRRGGGGSSRPRGTVERGCPISQLRPDAGPAPHLRVTGEENGGGGQEVTDTTWRQ